MATSIKAVEDSLDKLMDSAFDDAEILLAFDYRAGNQAVKLFEAMKSEALKLLGKTLTPADAVRVRSLLSNGNKLISLVDRQLPGINRRARAGVGIHDRLLKEDQKVLLKMEKAIPANKKAMQEAAKELVAAGGQDAGKLSLTVNGEQITSSDKVITVDYRATSAIDEPTVEILLRGPEGMPVRIEYAETAESKALNWDEDKLNKRVIKAGTRDDKIPNGELTELVFEGSKSKVRGSLEANLPGWNYEWKVDFKTRGLSAAYAFKVAIGERSPILFTLDMTFTAHGFERIPYKCDQYNGYGQEEASWGQPALRTFLKNFGEQHIKETNGKKPWVGNKGLQDGVKYGKHDGVSHMRGRGVDIRIWPRCTTKLISNADYNVEEHVKQIKSYFDNGAIYVATSSTPAASQCINLGLRVEERSKHISHDHVTIK